MSDIKGIEVKDLLGLSQPLTKLVEVAARGAGVIYAPFHEKRMAKATAEKIRIIADACQNSLQFPLNYNDAEGLEISTNLSAQELCRRSIARKIFQEMNKQQNIEEVLEYAKNILEQEKEVSKEPVSQTWLSNFFEAAGNVEEEDLQKIWGKLLAGEIKQPNSYSLRTLNTLKNMTSNEARIFQSLSSFVVMGEEKGFLPHDNELHTKYDIEYENILLLDDCGLINSQGETNCVFSFKPNNVEQLYNNNFVAKLHKKNCVDTDVQLDVYPLTSAGRELFNIVSKDSNLNFFKDIIKKIEQGNKNISVYIYKKELIAEKDGKIIEHIDIQHPIYPEK
ncbi:DUF2806 domain-containing protein [Candidatus Avelusimicrobium faecicola]|uniref:DUF2806 domain-containing protein n=1 Tax=Candidatus Avelusimicrobium faecicola TaxID=3416205 RepID=UPI003D13D52D